MKLNEKWGWFLGFTAVFAVLATWVFWGTWALDAVPVMPDCSTTHSPWWFQGAWRGILASGMMVPDDLKRFLASPYFWQELQYVLALYCAALGLAYFCRGRGLSWLASYGAGLLLAFSGYWMTLFSAGHLGWFRWMTYGVFAFGLADRALSGNHLRHWLLLGACVAWGSFYQPDLWLIFTTFTGVYFIFRAVSMRTLPWKGVLVAAAVCLLIGAPSFRHAFVNDLAGRNQQIKEGQTVASGGRGMSEAEKRWVFVTNWSLPPNESVEFFCSRVNGDTSCPFTLSLGRKAGGDVRPYTGALGRPLAAPQGNYRQHSLYVGFITCILALLGAIRGLRGFFNRTGECSDNRTVLFFVVAAILCWLFSLGRYCEPVYRVIFSLPFGDSLRAPVKWHHLTEFCLVVLAGFGIEALWLLLSRVASLKSFALPLVGILVFIGAMDLARVDHLYCAPVDVRAARRANATMQMAVLQRSQFKDPQVAEMVRRHQLVSLASYLGHPDYFLVGALRPCTPPKPFELPSPLILVLGGLSVLTTLGVLAFCALERKFT